MRTLDITTSDGTIWTATPADVAKAAETLLMDGTMVLSADEVELLVGHDRQIYELQVALIRELVERAIERGIVEMDRLVHNK
jgi:hypothetical protein